VRADPGWRRNGTADGHHPETYTAGAAFCETRHAAKPVDSVDFRRGVAESPGHPYPPDQEAPVMPKTIPTRDAYRHFISVPTRWADQDALAHINNAVYYTYFDTAVASFLHGTGVLEHDATAVTAVVVETTCRHHAPAFFPDVLSVGLRSGISAQRRSAMRSVFSAKGRTPRARKAISSTYMSTART
jgi:YbgC/YbaW family acyl-CoA thioester hydrolase